MIPKKPLTKRQHQVLRILYQFIKSEGFPPTFEDLKRLLDVASNQTITDLLVALEKKGTLKRGDGSARGLSITPQGFGELNVQPLLPLAGMSRGGPFTETVTMTGEWKTAGKEVSKLVNRDTFLIQVHGDSMEGVIWDGDVVLVMPVHDLKEIKNRDIVVVEHNGETTVKRFSSRGGRKHLEPENPKYSPLSIEPGMQITGKVIARM